MLEVFACFFVTVLPTYLFRHFVQGKRHGKEINISSIWYELRWGISAWVVLSMALIFFNRPSAPDVAVLNTPHSMATEHLPMFIAGPGETDVFFNVVVVIAIVVAMLFGALYFTLHALPEKMAHKVNSNQIQLIGVLGVIALFTHNNYFFFGALFLAVVRFPDWTSTLNSMANSLKKLAKRED